ncbi:hypothetical protein NPIL_251041 [Nephila pilipes]|uniref:Uncharacterized protein n=1 Tax=Nephila pilipes TaxID=299642 RepID=A0A8X6MQD0_NEPPI|nr:hypothetical protein NPIL_251041 [Nephila pilipes]
MTNAGTNNNAKKVATISSPIPDELSASLGSNSHLTTAQCSHLVPLININDFELISELLSHKVDEIDPDKNLPLQTPKTKTFLNSNTCFS